MAKIFLNIEASDPTDLHETLIGLVNAKIVVDPGDDNELAERVAGEQTGKRTRRTKAQIEADNAASQISNEKSGPSSAEPSHQPSASTDPFGDQIREVAAGAANEAKITMADLRTVGQAYMAKHSAKKLSDFLMEVGGAPNLTNIAPENFAKVHAALANAE